MNITELRDRIGYFYNNDVSVMVYFIMKEGDGLSVRLADIDRETVEPKIKESFLDSIKQSIIDDSELQVMNMSEADERKNVIYEYDLDERPPELYPLAEILENQQQQMYNFGIDSLSDIKGYIILIGDSQKKIALYKQNYGINILKKDVVMLYKKEQRFVDLDQDLIRFDHNYQFFMLDGTLFIKDLDKLERFFGFHEIIKKEAMTSISAIERANILEDVEVLRESVDNITFARKLTRVSLDSPVLGSIPVSTIIEFTKTYPALAKGFKYNDDGSKIVLDTKKSQNLFVKLLNDDFLRSELTSMYYSSVAKDRITLEKGA